MKSKVALIGTITRRPFGAMKEPKARDTWMKESKKILENLGANVVFVEIVNDIWAAKEAAKKVVGMRVDLVVVYPLVWAPGDITVSLSQEIPSIPLVLWTFVTSDLMGFLESSDDLKNLGIPFKPILGKNSEALEEMRVYMTAVSAVRRIRGAPLRVAQIGMASVGWLDCQGSDLDLRARLGLDIVHIDLLEVVREMEKVKDCETKEIISEFGANFGEIKAPRSEMLKAAKACVALDRIVERYGLGGYAIGCIRMGRGIPCLALSRLAEKGVLGGCEGDLPNTVAAVVAKELSGTPSIVYDIITVDLKENTMLLKAHCGCLPKQLVEDPSKVYIDVFGEGAVMQNARLKPGRVTVIRLDVRGDSMFIASGKALEEDRGKYPGIKVKFDRDIGDVLSSMVEAGVGHHVVVVVGDIKAELQAFCEITGIKPYVSLKKD